MIVTPPPSEPVPVCERVVVEEAHLAYPVILCGATRLPVRVLIVDGRDWPERSRPLGGDPAAIVFWQPGSEERLSAHP